MVKLCRLVASICLSVGLVSAGSGCKRDGGAGTGAAPSTQASSGLKTLRIGYFANATHAQAVIGVESGAFAKAIGPATLEPKLFNAGPSLIEAIFAGQVDIGYIGPGPALNGFDKSKGAGLRVISGAAANGVLIVARHGSGIQSLADLKGQRIATPQYGNTQDLAARAYLKSVLGQSDVENVKPVPNAEQLGQLTRGQIDVAWAPEPWGSYLIKEGNAVLIEKEEKLWKEGSFATTVVITTPDFLSKHPDVVSAVLKTHVELTQKLATEPARSVPELKAALFKLTNKQLPPGVLEAALANVTFTTDPLPHTFHKMSGWAFDLGFAKQRSDLSTLIDTTILSKVAGSASGPTTRRALDE